jgi:hypothetical protein
MAKDVDLIGWWQTLTTGERTAALEVGNDSTPAWMVKSLAKAGVVVAAAYGRTSAEHQHQALAYDLRSEHGPMGSRMAMTAVRHELARRGWS